MENGVLSISTASDGRLTYWLALLTVMGLTAVVQPPLMPAMQKGTKARSVSRREAMSAHRGFTVVSVAFIIRREHCHTAYIAMKPRRKRYQWRTVSAPSILRRLPSLENSLNTDIVVLRPVYWK